MKGIGTDRLDGAAPGADGGGPGAECALGSTVRILHTPGRSPVADGPRAGDARDGSRVRVHGPGWLKTRGFRVSDNRNPPVLRLSDFMETLENKGSHPVNAYGSRSEQEKSTAATGQ